MRQCIIMLVFALFLSAPAITSAQTAASKSDIPSVLVSGFESYKTSGPDEAVKTWIKGSPIDGSKDALGQANNLRMIQNFYGSYLSYDVVSIRTITPKVKVLYMVMNYESGPLFGKFVVYQTKQDWVLTSFNFNTKDEQILPQHP